MSLLLSVLCYSRVPFFNKAKSILKNDHSLGQSSQFNLKNLLALIND